MIRILLFIAAIFCTTPAFALDVSGTGFGRIPVLHEGRVKPLDSFARALHWRITGREHPRGISAEQWLADILFDPLTALECPQFIVRNPELITMMNLPARKGTLYNFAEISAGLAPHATMIGTLATQENLSKTQEQLLDLQKAVIDYTQLMRSLSLILPLSVTWPGAEGQDYLSLRRYEEQAQNKLAAIIRRKGDDIEKYSPEERNIAAFAFQITVMRESADGNNLLRVIPAPWQDGEFLSPWAIIQSGQGSPEAMQTINTWKNLAAAWMADDKSAFIKISYDLAQGTIYGQTLNEEKLTAEGFYNTLSPLGYASLFYAWAAVLAVLALCGFGNWRSPAWAVLLLGALIHTAGIALRVYILDRPPVGTLYESVLFVSLITVITALIAGRRQAAIIAAGALAGAGLLIMAPFLIRGGDTMPVLVAVLNTNFWLATHVIIITAGYGFALLCGLAGHIWLAAAALGKPQSILLAHRLAIVALLFTTVGTILGGIWADQSWGRFWGWDPKENGALLIVLWLVWVMHGRRAALLDPSLYAAGLAAVNIIVALAWFGVNLLNVGLHSYGFTSGIALALTAFCVTEMLVIAGLWYRGRRRAT
ncbi:MAG: cytochrome c biogenesis protein CcsA [Alphaproteobacteria bacterium]|nr:cytochrome c biogenesis protein CcsA [Alphaproteobacteria bacterium]MBU0858343.1 cytochrome c biogenesis protein CcsA [Alphaproteobacteria bacterium]